MTINVNCPPRGLFIGHETENGARALTVDFSAWAAEYSTGTLQILFQRPGTESPYAVVLTRDGTTATWKPSETDLAEAGTGAVQIIYTVGDVRVKTSIIPVMVEPSLGVETDPPEGWTSWIDQLTDLAAVTEQHAASAAESAENAGDSATDAQRYATDAGDAKNAAVAAAGAAAASASHYPQIVGGVWYVWSPAAGAYVSTGIDAQGEDGISPTVEITAIQGGHSVVITDAEGPHEFDVLDGVTPDLSAYRTAVEQDVIDDAQDEKLNNLKSAINAKAGILRDTVSGSVASFVPDSTVPNLLGLSVALEPIQDLHGYDSPWPAGGGKNKIVYPYFHVSGYTNNGVTFTVDADGTVTANGTATANAEFYVARNNVCNYPAGNYTLSGLPSGASLATFCYNCYAGSGDSGSNLWDFRAVSDRTVTAESEIKKFTLAIRIISGYTANNLVFKPMFESGSSASPFSPYSNICPISGRESVEVEAAGVNLFDADTLSQFSGVVVNDDGSIFVNNNNALYNKVIWKNPGYSGQLSLTFRYKYANTGALGLYPRAVYTDGTAENFPVQNSQDYVTATFTTSSNKIVDYITTTYSTGSNSTTFYLQLELGFTASEYKPYAGNRYTIPLPETVYGGTLDVTNGTLTVDRVKEVFMWGDLPLAETLTGYLRKRAILSTNSDSPYNTEQFCNLGVKIVDNASLTPHFYCLTNIGVFVMPDTMPNDTEIEVVYKIATPIVIDLDPVQIATIANQTNNVWTDAGDVSVEFAADLKTYIDNKIAAAVAALS